MGSHHIKSCLAVRDAVDRLHWEVLISTSDLSRDQAFVVHWEGCIVFAREQLPSNQGSAPSANRPTLPARWTNRENSSRLFGRGEVTFALVTDLPGDALQRIDSFRENGPLFARLEGKLVIVHQGPGIGGKYERPWLDDVAEIMGRGNRGWTNNVIGEPFNLRDIWCTQVLATLRPPGRFFLEVRVPLGHPHEEAAKRAVAELAKAQKAFDEEGRYSEVARACYVALEELRKLADRIEDDYGKFARGRFLDQIKETMSLCDPERHADRPHHDGLVFDRTLALHVLAVTSSIAGVVLR